MPGSDRQLYARHYDKAGSGGIPGSQAIQHERCGVQARCSSREWLRRSGFELPRFPTCAAMLLH